MAIIRVSEDGRITIPAAARKKLGIAPGSTVRIDIRETEIAVRPIKSITDVAGIFHEYAEGKTTDWDTIREQTMQAVAREVNKRSD